MEYIGEFETIQYNEFKKYKETAEKAMEDEDYPTAADAFLKAGRAIGKLAKVTENEKLKEKRLTLAKNYLQVGKELEKGIIPVKSKPKEYKTSEEVYGSTAGTESEEEQGFEKYVELNQILIRSIVLPPTIKSAIEGKLKQEQESLEYEFKLEKAEKEAERQRIDAEGKANANRILNASLTDKILREKGIIATLKLAESPNTKVVIIGNSADGLPLILGNSK